MLVMVMRKGKEMRERLSDARQSTSELCRGSTRLGKSGSRAPQRERPRTDSSRPHWLPRLPLVAFPGNRRGSRSRTPTSMHRCHLTVSLSAISQPSLSHLSPSLTHPLTHPSPIPHPSLTHQLSMSSLHDSQHASPLGSEGPGGWRSVGADPAKPCRRGLSLVKWLELSPPQPFFCCCPSCWFCLLQQHDHGPTTTNKPIISGPAEAQTSMSPCSKKGKRNS